AAALYGLLPLALMHNRFDQRWVRIDCFIITSSAAALLVYTSRMRDDGTRVRDCLAVICGFAVTFAIVLGVIFLRGSTARALWESQVAVNFALFIRLRDWQVPLFLRIAWVPWSAAGIAAAFLICRRRTVDNQDLWRVFKGLV